MQIEGLTENRLRGQLATTALSNAQYRSIHTSIQGHSIGAWSVPRGEQAVDWQA